MKYKKLDDVAARKLGHYVYALRDPRDGSIFYVGKGKKNRWFEHIKEARTRKTDPTLKLDQIRKIEASGRAVDAFIVRFGLSSDAAAFEVEAAVIHAYRLAAKRPKAPIQLANIAGVHHPERGLVDVKLAQTLFNAPRAPKITVPCAMFRIPKLWYPEMSDDELREATSGWWSARNVMKHKATAQYAFAVSQGIIRGVYAIDESLWRQRRRGDRDWRDDIGGQRRWGFPDCGPAPEMERYLNTSVKHLFKNGDANPVRFFNC